MDGREQGRIEYAMEHLFSFRAQVERPQVIGATAEGLRAFFPVEEGELLGPRVRGRVLKGGGDWILIRSDGVQLIDVRATVQTDDGALIYATYTGVGDLGEDGYANYLKGRGPGRVTIRATARYQTAHPAYRWLNRLQCVNVGEAEVQKRLLRYDVYGLR